MQQTPCPLGKCVVVVGVPTLQGCEAFSFVGVTSVCAGARNYTIPPSVSAVLSPASAAPGGSIELSAAAIVASVDTVISPTQTMRCHPESSEGPAICVGNRHQANGQAKLQRHAWRHSGGFSRLSRDSGRSPAIAMADINSATMAAAFKHKRYFVGELVAFAILSTGLA